MNLEILNARLARLGQRVRVARHEGGGLYYIVALGWKAAPGQHCDEEGNRVINSAMGWPWVLEWAAERARDEYRRVVCGNVWPHPLLKGL